MPFLERHFLYLYTKDFEERRSMKKLVLLLFYLISTAAFGQDIEDMQEGYNFFGGTNTHILVKISKPIFVADNKCFSNYEHARFEGGDALFSKDLAKYLVVYLDKDTYYAKGLFSINLEIDEKGRVGKTEVLPRLKNDDYFQTDVRYAIKRVKKAWKPATCNGIPVKSNIKIKTLFSPEFYDTYRL
ncbi:energy transducer TonB [Riemerella anatipestifer]|uniref:TonB C-terminal domain-containing protein n=1 Tax=Riemerella anatipestifer TaxID=34085 RepID=A0A1S7DRV9_RIEAN|nr:hypothetical protein [Riemerella anatipestifer]AQY21857.1 hypothetical protein AB406_0904 [Riemerella anatipestifer]